MTFLRAHGFSMELEPFAPDEFGVAAVFEVVLAWLETGKAHTIVRADGKTYPGVLLEHDMSAFTVPGHEKSRHKSANENSRYRVPDHDRKTGG